MISRSPVPGPQSPLHSPFTWPLRVYWEDTDAGGVVYHASYLRFLERARSEWLRDLGYAQQALREREDAVFVVRAMRLEFLRAARLDDELQVDVALVALRPASLLLAQSIRRGAGTLLTAEVRVACVSAGAFKPRLVPVGLAADLKRQTVRETVEQESPFSPILGKNM